MQRPYMHYIISESQYWIPHLVIVWWSCQHLRMYGLYTVYIDIPAAELQLNHMYAVNKAHVLLSQANAGLEPNDAGRETHT